MPGAVPWLRLNPKLLYVDELEFVFYLLFIDVTEERHVVPFDFLYKAELDDSRTTTRLTTVLFQRSCPRPWSPLVYASLVSSSRPAAGAFVCLVVRHCRVTQSSSPSFLLEWRSGRFPYFLLVHFGKHEQREVQRPCTDVGFVLIREFVP